MVSHTLGSFSRQKAVENFVIHWAHTWLHMSFKCFWDLYSTASASPWSSLSSFPKKICPEYGRGFTRSCVSAGSWTKTQQGWEVWPSCSRWFVTWISKHIFEFFTDISDQWYWATIVTSSLFLALIHFSCYRVLFFNVHFGFSFNFMDSTCSPHPIFNIYYPNTACI